jgi:hypothetical protein
MTDELEERADKADVSRRTSDRRLDDLDRKFDAMSMKLNEIRDWLIGEPESSALGRQLLDRAKSNKESIERITARLDLLEDWRTAWQGAWRFVVSAVVVLGLITTGLGLLAYFRLLHT